MAASEIESSIAPVTLAVATADTSIWHDSILEMSVFQENMGNNSKIPLSPPKIGSEQISSGEVARNQGIAEVSFDQISFIQPSINQLGTTEISPIQVSFPKIGFLQISPAQVSLRQVSTLKISSPQAGVGEVSSTHVGSGKIAFSQIEIAEVGSSQVDLIKDNSLQLRIPKISTTQVGSMEEVIGKTLNFTNMDWAFSNSVSEINSNKTSLPSSITFEQFPNRHPLSVHDSTYPSLKVLKHYNLP